MDGPVGRSFVDLGSSVGHMNLVAQRFDEQFKCVRTITIIIDNEDSTMRTRCGLSLNEMLHWITVCIPSSYLLATNIRRMFLTMFIFEWESVVLNGSGIVQLLHGEHTCLLVLEKANFPQFFAEKMFGFVIEELGQERIDVRYLLCGSVLDQDSIMGSVEQSPKTANMNTETGDAIPNFASRDPQYLIHAVVVDRRLEERDPRDPLNSCRASRIGKSLEQ